MHCVTGFEDKSQIQVKLSIRGCFFGVFFGDICYTRMPEESDFNFVCVGA